MEPAEVKSEAPEVEEGTPNNTPTPPPPPAEKHTRRNLRGSASDVNNNDEAATLAELWPSRKSKSDTAATSGKAGKTVEKKDWTSKMRKRLSNSTTKPPVALRSGKRLRSGTPTVTRTAVWLKAEEVRSNLDPNFPSFIKVLVRSHVGSCFFLGFPSPFGKAYLPQTDTAIIVEDEQGKQYEVKYIGQKTGLSAGWRQFSVDHNLLEGDVLVFQLVEASKLKVHIIRKSDNREIEGAVGLLNPDSPAENPGTDIPQADMIASKRGRRKRPKSLPLSILQKNKKKPRQQKSLTPEIGRSAQQSGNDSEEVGSEVLESSRLSVTKVQFKDVAALENFKILIEGVLVDSEFLEDTRRKYYELCCSQNEFLHENLMEGINLKLIIGAIAEIVGISDAIRACDLATTQDKFLSWDRTLHAFELLGMKVGFLRKRVNWLITLAFESESAAEARKLAEAKSKRASAEEEIRKLELRLLELEEVNENLGAEIESLRPKVETHALKFLEEVNAPW
ncbi:B3 domain-containing protein Os01g0234100-like isoform X2 [Punica granatum]|uniref:B3 domain-containing protein Os01g0234100-like isoform X2 n=2 Tax=Punica granatum TaxID=22663 RepID=A0A6P8D1Z0_PUNGR|nr:B3 domain-containing protein Os01g0234100-like isoform X2 [Punica granatum]PKI50119.1 hypothetical protein CRG98_029443 [Punica granatum]